MKLERLSPHFETRGFRSRRSLAYVKVDDLDVFFDSPNKLLLAERRVLEAELNKIKAQENKHQQPERPESARKLHYDSTCNAQALLSAHSSSSSSHEAGGTMSALDRRAMEHKESLELLSAQVESVKQHLEGKRKAVERYSTASVGRRGKVCTLCHKSGHNKARCKGFPCPDITVCQLQDKHPETQTEIREIQKELKELESKYTKAKNDNDVFIASRLRAKSNFFAIMRPRLKQQNQAKYVDRSALDRDLQILQRALTNKIPIDTANDWRLPTMIEEYKRGVDAYRPLNNHDQAFGPSYTSSSSTSNTYYHM